MNFKVGDHIVIVSAGSIFTREERVGVKGTIIEVMKDTVVIEGDKGGRLNAAISDIDHLSDDYHLHVD